MDLKHYNATLSQLEKLLAGDSNNNWMMGDLILALIPMRTDRKTDTPGRVVKTLYQLSHDLGGDLKASRMEQLRSVSYRFPPRERKRASWTVHFMLKSKPEKVKDGMTVAEAKKLLGRNRRNQFVYTQELLKSAARFAEVSARYAARNEHRRDRMDTLRPLVSSLASWVNLLTETVESGEDSARKRPTRRAA